MFPSNSGLSAISRSGLDAVLVLMVSVKDEIDITVGQVWSYLFLDINDEICNKTICWTMYSPSMTVASASPAFLRETSIWSDLLSFDLALQIRIPSFMNIAVDNVLIHAYIVVFLVNVNVLQVVKDAFTGFCYDSICVILFVIHKSESLGGTATKGYYISNTRWR